MKRYTALGALVSSFFLFSCQTVESKVCPDENLVESNLKRLVNRDFKIESLKPLEEIKGLCEVVLKVGLSPVVVYTNNEGKHFIVGNIFNAETKENITQKTAEQYRTVSQEILQELEKHVNMTYGEGEKFVYYITDPDCPFCRRFSPMLKEWADKNKVQVKVILYPLPIHPEAKPKTIAMVCDKLGYDDIHRNIDTKNQCEEGKKAIENNLELLSKIGISGTPTVIGMNGKVVVGIPRSMDELKSLVQ